MKENKNSYDWSSIASISLLMPYEIITYHAYRMKIDKGKDKENDKQIILSNKKIEKIREESRCLKK